MNPARAKQTIEKVLAPAGISINGNGDADIRVKNPAFYNRVLTKGTLGAGESYVEGWWDTSHLDILTERVLLSDIHDAINELSISNKIHLTLNDFFTQVFNRQNRRRSFCAGEHYDSGNELFRCMLDRRMIYSCGYWKSAQTLDEAQEAKLDLICKKLYLKPGMRILDIGCGWGGFAQFAAENYGVSVAGITVSKEQFSWAVEQCKRLPVEIRLKDYRDLPADHAFDAVVSVGMIEHVGYKNYRNYMKIVKQCLKPGGLFLLQTIGGNVSANNLGRWMDRYIFPNGVLPSAARISKTCEKLFVIEDWHNFGPDYDKTLMAWFKNLDSNWYLLKKQYSEEFYRMWKFYLLTCAGSFRARYNQLWQLVLSDTGVKGGYLPVR